jgi:ribulose-5-phosphate 4-epimerase/fuculose-1-phosphate aldolase
MINEKLTKPGVQTLFVSKEQSNCPLIPDIVRLGKKFKDLGLLEEITTAFVSLKYGKRLLTNGSNSNIGNIKIDDILEIVDYNPTKKIILAIGSKNPYIETSVHWLIHHARDDVNAVIQFNSEKLAERLSKKLPTTEKEKPPGTFELAKEVLKILRTSKNLVIKNSGVLFVGNSLKEAEESALITLRESL